MVCVYALLARNCQVIFSKRLAIHPAFSISLARITSSAAKADWVGETIGQLQQAANGLQALQYTAKGLYTNLGSTFITPVGVAARGRIISEVWRDSAELPKTFRALRLTCSHAAPICAIIFWSSICCVVGVSARLRMGTFSSPQRCPPVRGSVSFFHHSRENGIAGFRPRDERH